MLKHERDKYMARLDQAQFELNPKGDSWEWEVVFDEPMTLDRMLLQWRTLSAGKTWKDKDTLIEKGEAVLKEYTEQKQNDVTETETPETETKETTESKTETKNVETLKQWIRNGASARTYGVYALGWAHEYMGATWLYSFADTFENPTAIDRVLRTVLLLARGATILVYFVCHGIPAILLTGVGLAAAWKSATFVGMAVAATSTLAPAAMGFAFTMVIGVLIRHFLLSAVIGEKWTQRLTMAFAALNVACAVYYGADYYNIMKEDTEPLQLMCTTLEHALQKTPKADLFNNFGAFLQGQVPIYSVGDSETGSTFELDGTFFNPMHALFNLETMFNQMTP